MNEPAEAARFANSDDLQTWLARRTGSRAVAARVTHLARQGRVVTTTNRAAAGEPSWTIAPNGDGTYIALPQAGPSEGWS